MLAAGTGPFQPRVGKTLRNYYEVPVDVMEDADRLVAWARRAGDRPAARAPAPASAQKRTPNVSPGITSALPRRVLRLVKLSRNVPVTFSLSVSA